MDWLDANPSVDYPFWMHLVWLSAIHNSGIIMRRTLIAMAVTAAVLGVSASGASAYGLFNSGNDNSYGGGDGAKYSLTAPMPLLFEHQGPTAGFDSDHVTINSATFKGVPIPVTVAPGERTSIYFNWLWLFSIVPASGSWPAGTGTFTVDGFLSGKGADAGNNLGFTASFTNTTFDGIPPKIDSASVNGLAKATTSPDVYIEAGASDNFCGTGLAVTPGTTTFASMPGLPGPRIFQQTSVPVGNMLPITLQASDCVGNTTDRSFALEYAPAPTSGLQALSKDGGTLFTGSTNIDLHIYGPKYASEMLVSNEGSFVGASWQPYDWKQPWTITKLGAYTLARTVYAKFKLANGGESGVFSDDIIYDPLDPVLSDASLHGGGVGASAASKATLRVKVNDRGPSGLGRLEIKTSGPRKRVKSMNFKKSVRVPLSKHMSVRVLDNAGNPSKWKKLR
jgi:hypothetical protein